MRVRYHIFMCELWGNLSGRLIYWSAQHANKINDMVTLRRCQAVVKHGVEVGWDKNRDDWRATPNRPDPGEYA